MDVLKKSSKRKAVAKKIIRQRMLYAAGLGLIPIPIVDAAGILSNQVLMLRDIAKVYRIPFKDQAAKSLIGALVSSVGTASVIKALPGLGTIIGGAVISMTGIATTYALGKIFTLHFEQGGTLLDFDPVKSRKYFQQAYKEGELRATALKEDSKPILTKLFQNKQAKKGDKGESNDVVINKAALEASIKKAKRRKVLKAKRRRRARFKKLLRQLFILLLISAVIGWFYYKYLSHRLIDKDAAETTEIDLFMEENQAQAVKLEPAETLDSLTLVKLSKFSPVSTEGVITKYIQNPKATYPKRYSLNAVRFTGSSEKLSSGAKEQLANIAFLMKKYPNLLVNIYGHTTSKGPIFNRQRIGRDRARVLKDVFVNQGIASYRITGNYIEKSQGTHDEYWGAELVLHVSTIESVVEVQPPSLTDQLTTPLSNILKPIQRQEETPKEDTIKLVEVDTPSQTPPPVNDKEENLAKPIIVPPPVIEMVTDTQKEEINTPIEDTIETEQPEIPSEKEPEKEPEQSLPPPAPEEKKPAKKIVTLEGVMQQYIESSNPKYPKAFPLNAISFNGESTEVNNKGQIQLEKIAVLMKKYPQMKITVNGEAAGKATVNTVEEKNRFLTKWQGIGEKRARAIKKVLRDQGIANRRIKTGFRLQNRGEEMKNWGADLVIESN